MSKLIINNFHNTYFRKFKNDILNHQNNIKILKQQITQISKSKFDLSYKCNKISICENNIKKNEKNIIELNDKIGKLNSGLLDHEIQSELECNIKNVIKKSNIKFKKKSDKKNEEKAIYEKTMLKYKKENKKRRQNRRDQRYFYKLYIRANKTLPNYMRKNLKVMANNKGYIWRGVYFFGEQEAEKESAIVMFEKNKGVLKITEINKDNVKKYEKVGRNRKKLISIKKRRQIKK